MSEIKNNSILKTENLAIGYTSKKSQNIVASNINLSIEKGKLVAVLGKNGIGKSTLLRTIAKVQKPLSGSVLIHQKNLNSISEKDLAKQVGLVLTERLPESQLTVFELIALGRQPYTNCLDKLSKTDIKKIDFAIQQTNIEHLKNKNFYELSDGQLQRVLIARAIAQDTEMIILDEPTAHLDLHHTFKIFTLLQKLVSETQKTIVLSTHQVNLAIKFADEVILFSENKVKSGSTATLIYNNDFDNLFPKEIINFDKNLQQFIINKQ